jgi:hypothetical protein
MKEYIVTIENQIEIFNIVGISEHGLFHIIKAYYNEESNVKLGGEKFSLKGIHTIKIHEFDNEDVLNSFLRHDKEKSLKKRNITGDYYFDLEILSSFSKDLTMHYLSPENDPRNKRSSQVDYSINDMKDIFNGIDEIIERLSKLELGQKIIYDDLKEDLEEVKEFVGKTSKKTLRQLILEKLVDAGLGSLTGEVVDGIKSLDIKALL